MSHRNVGVYGTSAEALARGDSADGTLLALSLQTNFTNSGPRVGTEGKLHWTEGRIMLRLFANWAWSQAGLCYRF